MVEKTATFRQRRAADTARWRERLHRGAVQKHIEIAEPSKTSVRAPGGPRRRRLALGQPSVQFRWLVVLAVSPGRCVDTRLQARKAGVGLRSKIRKHLVVASFDLGENFIDARKHAPDNLGHLAPQDVEFAAQPLDISLALFTAHRTSSQNCSNSARKSNGGPQEPSDSTGVAV
jgi:hypothetical protein